MGIRIMLHVPCSLGDVTLVAWPGNADAVEAARLSLPDGWDLSMCPDNSTTGPGQGGRVVDMFTRGKVKRLRVHGPFELRRCMGSFAHFTPKGLGDYLNRLKASPFEAIVCLATFDGPSQIRQTGWLGAIEIGNLQPGRRRVTKRMKKKSPGGLIPADILTHDFIKSRDVPPAHREALNDLLTHLENRSAALPSLLASPGAGTACIPPADQPTWTREEIEKGEDALG